MQDGKDEKVPEPDDINHEKRQKLIEENKKQEAEMLDAVHALQSTTTEARRRILGDEWRLRRRST